MSQTFPEGRRTPAELPDSEVRQTSNIIYLTPRQMVEATRDTEAGWSPIDEDEATKQEALDWIGEWIFLAAGAVCALIVVAFFLIGRGF